MRLHVVHHGLRRRRALRRRALWSGGEVLVTVGVLVLLLVVHQLWWTNREAREGAQRKVEALERTWDDGDGNGGGGGDGGGDGSGHGAGLGSGTGGGDSGTSGPSGSAGEWAARQPGGPTAGDRSSAPHRSQAYAILTIPRLHLRVPVAEGVSKRNVLNKGYVGHYPGTQQPGQAGNFALAGHRNTHGEPFRYLNRLRSKDIVEVETKGAVYTYAVDKTLPQTSARDASVIHRIPRSTVHPRHGYTDPGYYLTLTTCTPEYTSRYRMVVWAGLVSMRPRPAQE